MSNSRPKQPADGSDNPSSNGPSPAANGDLPTNRPPFLDDPALVAQLIVLAEQANRLDLAEALRGRGLVDECKPFVVGASDKAAVSQPQENVPAAIDKPPVAEPAAQANGGSRAPRIKGGEFGETVTLTATGSSYHVDSTPGLLEGFLINRASGLPAGLSIDPSKGIMTGAISSEGSSGQPWRHVQYSVWPPRHD